MLRFRRVGPVTVVTKTARVDGGWYVVRRKFCFTARQVEREVQRAYGVRRRP